jgi:hypothetical protein
MWCSAWVEVLDHTHWATIGLLVCFDVGPEVHADAAASFCLREVARRLGHVPVRLLGGAIFFRVEFGVGGPERRALASCSIRSMILSGTRA